LKHLTLAVLGALLIAAPVSAQVGWSIGGGVTLPQGDAGDGFNSGFHGMGAATFTLPASPIRVRADFGYNTMPHKDDALDYNMNIWTVSGDAQWSIVPGPLSPYLIGGLTWGNLSLGGDEAPDLDSEGDLGFNLGAGLDFGLGPLQFFAEARYFMLDGTEILPVTLGLRF